MADRVIRPGVTLSEVLSFLDGIVTGLEFSHPTPLDQWDEHSKGVYEAATTVTDFLTDPRRDDGRFPDVDREIARIAQAATIPSHILGGDAGVRTVEGETYP